MALGFGLMVSSAAKQLSQALEPSIPTGGGTLTLESSGTVQYGDTVSYKAVMDNPEKIAANIYISTVCFQGETMVFQKSVTQGVTVHLYDQMERDYEWNGKDASCIATLLYRTVGRDFHQVVLVDSEYFDVVAQKS
ncbi:MAG: hypothetical protein UU98_C0021G0009 [Parcubacteria group bacterium GW2011_GWD2_42_14]|nr:MAG: hypothetical protein UU98_C0021G0009 [Parcubacteria group bacterium GW2011_GWD2_42_14]